jgi:hypothetical protein
MGIDQLSAMEKRNGASAAKSSPLSISNNTLTISRIQFLGASNTMLDSISRMIQLSSLDTLAPPADAILGLLR